MKKVSRTLATIVLAVSMVLIPFGVAFAETVYYKGSPVNWDHGRFMWAWSYSKVQTSKFTHSATANGVFSGWKKPGDLASATAYVGKSRATAYWNCK